MRTLGVEVVARAIQVHRHQIDGVEAVLVAVSLGLDQKHLLGQTIGGVGLFGIAVPELFLAERHRGELGVGADRADGEELGNASLTGLLDELDAHDGVVVEETSGVGPVGPDATDDGRKVDDQIRLTGREGTIDVGQGAQVVIFDQRNEDLSGSSLAESTNHGGAQEPRPTRDHDPAATPERSHTPVSAAGGLEVLEGSNPAKPATAAISTS